MWALYTVYQAARLKTSSSCKIMGFPTFINAWPLVSWGIIILGLNWLGVSPTALGLVWSGILTAVLVMLGIQLSNRVIGWVAALIFGALALCVSLHYGFQLDVWRALGDFFNWFGVTLSPGTVMLAGFAVLVVTAIMLPGVFLSNTLSIEGNNYIPNKAMGRETTCSHETHVLIARTPDWLERIFMGVVNLQLVSRYDLQGRRYDPQDGVQEGAYCLDCVPGGHIANALIQKAMAAEEIERRKPEQAA